MKEEKKTRNEEKRGARDADEERATIYNNNKTLALNTDAERTHNTKICEKSLIFRRVAFVCAARTAYSFSWNEFYFNRHIIPYYSYVN